MSVATTLEPSAWRAFAFSKASATASETVAVNSTRCPGLLLSAKLSDSLGDQLGLDPLLKRLDLSLDLPVEFGDLLAHPRTRELAVAALIAIMVA